MIAVDIRALLGGNVSGVETYIYELIKELLRIDTDNTYVFYLNAFSKQDELFAGLREMIKTEPGNNGNIVFLQTRIPNKIFNLSLMILRRPLLDQLVQRRTGLKPDTFFFPDLRPAPVSKHVKKICTVHDLAFEHSPSLYSRKCRIWFWLMNPRRELAEADKIIAVSKFTKSDLLS